MNRNREGIQTSITVTLVVGLTFALRIAACRESFWLDELHSVWAISDGFGTVSERAGAGNQTASYFQLLWIWGRIFGSGEVALRASSVLVSCIAAAFLVVGVKKQSGSLAGGLVAGALFAIEPNSVFFGSELRPYAWVMLCGVLSLWSMMASVRSLEGNVERSHQGWHRFWMMFWLCAASLLHPTSLGTLGWFLPIVFLIPLLKRRLRWGRWDAFAFALLAVTGALLLRSSLTHAWQQREQWNSFAAARSIEQLLTIWQYVPLVVWPLVIAAAGYTCSSLQRVKIENEANDKPRGLGLLPMLVALAATTGFFIASYAEIVPLWHRRYFIVAVPLMAWSVGELIGWTNTVLRRNFLLGAALTCVCLIGQTFAFYRVGIGPSGWPIWRYENWRDAVTLVAKSKDEEAEVWLDSGLIETQFLRHPAGATRPRSSLESDYLRFPLRGTYRAGRAADPVSISICSVTEHEDWLIQRLNEMSRKGVEEIWLLSRSSPSSVARYLDRIEDLAGFDHEVVLQSRPSVVRLRSSSGGIPMPGDPQAERPQAGESQDQ